MDVLEKKYSFYGKKGNEDGIFIGKRIGIKTTIKDILGETTFNGKNIITIETNKGEVKGINLNNHDIIDLNIK